MPSTRKGGVITMLRKLSLVMLLLAAVMLVMVACARNGEGETPAGDDEPTQTVTTPPPADDNGDEDDDEEVEFDLEFDDEERQHNPFAVLEEIAGQFSNHVANPNPVMDGGTLRWGFGSARGFQGIFCPVFWIWSEDADLRSLFFEELIGLGLDFTPVNDRNLANVYFDRDARTVTIVKNHRSYWHDGVPVTLDDVVFAYEVIAHGDYTGPRWGVNISNVVGVTEYRAGDVDYIAGLELSEDKMTLVLHMIDFPPTIEQWGFWGSPLPRHHWEGIAIADMEGHANARHNVLGNGPFILYSMVEGESIHVVRNENYWRGVPTLEAITVEIIAPLMLPMAMQQGLYDIGSPFPQSQFTPEFRYMDNVQFLSTLQTHNSNSWLAFRSGYFCPDLEEVVTFPEEEWRVSRPVRQALALSIDHISAGMLFNGLVVPTGSVYFGIRRMPWIDTSLETWNSFDMERAAQILDDAGYDQRDAEGYRLRPDGTDLTIIYMATSGTPANETSRAMEIQNWSDLGLRVEFYQGRLIEGTVASDVQFNETDDGVVDMFTHGWGFGASPNPWNIFGYETRNNLARFRSPQWEYVLSRFQSDDMWEQDFLLDTVQMWQEAVSEAGVIFPTTAAIGLTAVNNRVANFSLYLTGSRDVISSWNAWKWGLTADEAYVATN